MTLFDVVLLLAIAFSGLVGWHRGGVREVVTLAGVGGGFLAVALFGTQAAEAAPGGLSALLVLIGVFLVGDALVSLPGAILVRRFLGAEKKQADRLAGTGFGLLRGWVLAAFMVFTVEVYHTGTALPGWAERSFLAPPLSQTARALLRNTDVSVMELSGRQKGHISPLAKAAGT